MPLFEFHYLQCTYLLIALLFSRSLWLWAQYKLIQTLFIITIRVSDDLKNK